MGNKEGLQEEIKRINKALGEDSKYKCEKYYGDGYEIEKVWSIHND